MKLLITGANGYIGSNVAKELHKQGFDIVCVDLDNNHLDEDINFVKANICEFNENLYEEVGKPDACLHLAWRDGFNHNSPAHFGDLPYHKKFLSYLIDKGVKDITVMGTSHEVGYFEGKIDETTPCHPKTPYGSAKVELREYLEEECKKHNVILKWIRAFYIYSNNDVIGNSIFAKITQAALRGEKEFPFTTGKNKFDFIQMEELVRQIVLITTQTKEIGIINACSGAPISLGEMVEKYIKVNNLDIKLKYGQFQERADESPCLYGDNTIINRIKHKSNWKILVTGVKGQLGYDCVRELKERGYQNVLGVDIDELDITDEEAVHKLINEYKPNVVMHNAAWTAVDKAEQMPELVHKVNVLGPKYIAEACKDVGAKMVQISTDYVFDGLGESPFEVNDPKDGLSVYGKSKAECEDVVTSTLEKYFIVRISWAFGINGNNFVKTMLKLADMGKTELNIVCDQIGSPTYTYDLSKLLCDMIETDKYGVYHATNEGFCSWAEFAEYIFKTAKKPVKVNYVTTKEYEKLVPNQASRPHNSRLSKESLVKAGFNPLPTWKDAIDRYLKELVG